MVRVFQTTCLMKSLSNKSERRSWPLWFLPPRIQVFLRIRVEPSSGSTKPAAIEPTKWRRAGPIRMQPMNLWLRKGARAHPQLKRHNPAYRPTWSRISLMWEAWVTRDREDSGPLEDLLGSVPMESTRRCDHPC